MTWDDETITLDTVDYRDGKLVFDPPVVIPVNRVGEYFFPDYCHDGEWSGLGNGRYQLVDEIAADLYSSVMFMWNGFKANGDEWDNAHAAEWRSRVRFVRNGGDG